MTITDSYAEQSQLGKQTDYSATYDPTKLFAIPRASKRQDIAIFGDSLPFHGYDQWHHYEVSWLNTKGKPIVAVATLVFNCASPFLLESKSVKLYFNSLNNSCFSDERVVAKCIENDLTSQVESPVQVSLIPLANYQPLAVRAFQGYCIDQLDIACATYTVDPNLLQIGTAEVTEILYSDLLKSNCLVTGQPDWASIQISYEGKKIDHASLLRYLVSFRNHNEFAEHCIERIFMDLLRYCRPRMLTVHIRYTRRGGIEINSSRSTQALSYPTCHYQLSRQ